MILIFIWYYYDVLLPRGVVLSRPHHDGRGTNVFRCRSGSQYWVVLVKYDSVFCSLVSRGTVWVVIVCLSSIRNDPRGHTPRWWHDTPLAEFWVLMKSWDLHGQTQCSAGLQRLSSHILNIQCSHHSSCHNPSTDHFYKLNHTKQIIHHGSFGTCSCRPWASAHGSRQDPWPVS